FNGVRLRFRYEMRKDDRLAAVGRSEHCFVNGDGKLLRLKREYPELYDRLKALAPEEEGSADR
ncbi:MAG: acyl-CoA thioesterase, partial [Oscillospiraceae bacterium]|nr:acyl-CoA thioesterase [Oscillospiraceae bacterium]